MQSHHKGILVAALLTASIGLAEAGENGELVSYMSSMQYFAHKTGLAIDNKNHKLAKFYTHELEEYLEKVGKVDAYDGQPIGKLTESILMPAFEEFENALDAAQWDTTSSKFDMLLEKCNACHNASDHGYIQIQRSTSNPFMQSFAPPAGGN